jgi:arginase
MPDVKLSELAYMSTDNVEKLEKVDPLVAHNVKPIVKHPISLIDAPSNLGLKPPASGKVPGVYKLPDALRSAGLMSALGAMEGGRITPLPYAPERDPITNIRNSASIRRYSASLAHEVKHVIQSGRFPLVLGGDCSILIGIMLGLKQAGNYGLFYIDGHRDFLTPAQSQTGGAAGMDLAIVTGRGPEQLTNIDGCMPYVQDRDVVAFGFRDVEDPNVDPYREIFQTNLTLYSLSAVREIGLQETVARSISRLRERNLKGIWLHLDADVLDDQIMPAVDSPQIGGMNFEELSELLSLLLLSGIAVGMDVTIFDPEHDADGTIARNFTRAIVSGFQAKPFQALP